MIVGMVPASYLNLPRETIMEPETFWRCTAYDPHGIKRVWGEGPTKQEAEDECAEAIKDYLKVRPDLGPWSEWRIESSIQY
jgi:hypothetical protein